MIDGGLAPDLRDALRAGDAELDRGLRGPGTEIELIRRAGLLTAALPPDLDGLGWGTTPEGAHALRRTLEALGGASLSVARLYEGHVNAVRLVSDHATQAQRARVAAAIRDGAMMGVWGADSPGLPVTIARDRLSGRKAFASGLGVVSLAVVTARDQAGLNMVLATTTDVVRQSPEAWDMDAMVGSRSGGFDVADLPAEEDYRLGAPDALLLEPAFHGGIWRLVACYAGAMARIAHEAKVTAAGRGAAGDPLPHHRLGEIVLEAETAALWSRAACEAVERGVDADAAVRITLFAREAVERAADRQSATVERLGGTAIHRRDAALSRTLRDLRLYLRQANLDGKLALATALWKGDEGAPKG